MSERLRVLPQYLLPQHALTSLMGVLARQQGGALTTWAIRRFIQRYKVDMSEAAEPDPAAYKTFNEFFTRALRPGARPMSVAPLVCPVDGTVSQLGRIRGDQLVQAKGHTFTTEQLLGGDSSLARRFQDGWFATIYLSPRDYHRVHMPCSGRLARMLYVPGELFSVNPLTARHVPGLFARNERLICVFDSPPIGYYAMVMVGATIVGSMSTVWHGEVVRSRDTTVQEWFYDDPPVNLRQGAEMGRFQLGSTVVMMFPQHLPGPADVQFNMHWAPGRAVRLGEPMAL